LDNGGGYMKPRRIFEIDLLRVLAIILMVIFHFVYDLSEFGRLDINYTAPLWYIIGKTAALTFIFVSGISSGLSRNSVKGGLKVFSWGMLLTFITYLFDKSEYIRFGILHFLGISMILFPILNKMKKWQLVLLSVLIIFMGSFAAQTVVGTFLLLPLGFMYRNFSTLDYYPLLPYLSIFIIGVLAYKIFYYKENSFFHDRYNSKTVNYLSKNSLKIYLLHQPIIIGIIFLIQFLNK
jgi:uncharacterized membrane protein